MKTNIMTYLKLFIGAVFIAVGLYFFWAPSDLAAGGVSGLSIVIKAIVPFIPIGVIIFILDIIMFLIGFIILGKSFGARSLICSVSVSIIMTLLEFIFPSWEAVSEDYLLVLLFGALFIAIGQAIVFNIDASSGGTDIIAKIITKYIPINIGTALLIADMTVVLLATTLFGLEKGLYAALGVIITTQLIDYFISGLNIKKYIMIIPSNRERADKINSYILNDLDRGATVYKAEGAYSGESKKVITTVMDRKELVILKKEVEHIDPEAFMTVQNLHDICGEGF